MGSSVTQTVAAQFATLSPPPSSGTAFLSHAYLNPLWQAPLPKDQHKFPHAKLQLWGKYNQAYFNKQTKAHLVKTPHTVDAVHSPLQTTRSSAEDQPEGKNSQNTTAELTQ